LARQKATHGQHTGLIPVGVKFCFADDIGSDTHRPERPLKYCEAVNKVMTSFEDLLLKGEDISCPAAAEILGLAHCDRCPLGECLKELTVNGRFTDEQSALRALSSIPRLQAKPNSIILSANLVDPDVYIYYLRPKDFMKVVQNYQKSSGEELTTDISSVMPVCGNCTVRPYVTNRICISFGCPDSRKYGGITDDKLVVGVPSQKENFITRSISEMVDDENT
jgi:uncharacterized protein (DUF169 family)